MKRWGFLNALAYRDFRRLWICNFVSNLGTWVHTVALALWVYRNYPAPGWLGFIQFCSYFPSFIFFLLAGSLADLVSRKALLIVTQLIMAGGAFALALMVHLGAANISIVAITVTIIGVGLAFSFPAWQAIIPDLVPSRSMLNAVSLNSASWNMARFLGPLLGGLIISLWSLPACFYLNSLSFLPFALVMVMVQLPRRHKDDWKDRLNLSHLTEGIRYSLKRSWARNLLLTFGLINLLALPYLAFLPVFGSDILKKGELGTEALFAAAGMGAVMGVPVLALLNRRQEERTIIRLGVLALSGSLIIFSFSENFWLSLCALFLAGISFLITASSINTLLQLKVDEELRGRVMSLYVMMLTGIYPIGSGLMGLISNHFGVPRVLGISSFLVLLYGINLVFSGQLNEAQVSK